MTRQYNRSTIRKRLLYRLISAVILIWCVVVVFVYTAVEHEVEEVFDATLAQEARVLATLLNHEAEEEAERQKILAGLVSELGDEALERSALFARLVREYGKGTGKDDYLTLLTPAGGPGHPYEAKIAFRVSYVDGGMMLRSPNAPGFDTGEEGFQDYSNGGDPWRVFNMPVPESGLLVQVGEQVSVRQETMRYLLVNSMWPIFLSLPMLGLIIWVSVGNGLKPLTAVAEIVEHRRPGSLEPIPTGGVPGEVVPMVDSLNHLFRRVHHALESERRFTANAAHELRTPLAALKTQAQAKQLRDEGGENAQFLAQIIEGVDRTTHLLEQLLALARADVLERESILRNTVDLRAITAGVLSSLAARALEKQIDLFLESDPAPVSVRGDETSLGILINNLVDNAIRYTPPGGSVGVRLSHQGRAARLSVQDTGPGIPEDQREMLFERFRRGEGVEARGSGLGLSIVRQIAELHGAGISLADVSGEGGLVVTISFPD